MTPVTIYLGVGLTWAFSFLVMIYVPQFPDTETRQARALFAERPLVSLTTLLLVCTFFWPLLFLADLTKGFSR